MSASVLITGANRGIGLEFVRQYLAEGYTVVATCRNKGAASELTALTGQAGPGLRVLELEVTDAASIKALAKSVAEQPLDLLINNAGVYGPKGAALGQLEGSDWLQVFATNSIAPLQITAALLPNLKLAKQAKVVVISSKMGSIADNSSGGAYIYRSSKAAVNAAMASAAIDLRDDDISVGILHPGWVETDMGGANALIDTHTSVAGMREVIANLSLSGTGKFLSYDGTEISW